MRNAPYVPRLSSKLVLIFSVNTRSFVILSLSGLPREA